MLARFSVRIGPEGSNRCQLCKTTEVCVRSGGMPSEAAKALRGIAMPARLFARV